jgi:acetyl esterase/lipase
MTRDILSLSPVPADGRIAYGTDVSQFLDIYDAPDARAIILMIHGGFWRARYDLLHTSHLCATLARSGMTVANVEYRRVGNPGGGWPGTYADIRAALAFVRRQFGLDKPYVAIGHSAGGHLALRLAVDEPALAGVVALAPVAVLQAAFDLNLSEGAVAEFLGGAPADVPAAYRAACPSLHSSSVQRILLHGEEDDSVPITLSRDFEQLRQNDSGTVWFMKLQETNHFDLIDPESRAWPIVHMDTESLIEG